MLVAGHDRRQADLPAKVPAIPLPRLGAATVPVVAWFVHLLLVMVTAAVTVALSPGRDHLRHQYAHGPAGSIIEALVLWDGGWYQLIASQGYGTYRLTAAFWPLFPTLMRFGHDLTGADLGVVGVVLANAAFLVALIVLFSLVRLDFGEGVAERTVWLIALFPVAFFFSAVYTESLFLLLSVVAWYCGRTGRWTGAAFAAVLAAMTRNTGVLVVIPLTIMLLEQHGIDLGRCWNLARYGGTARYQWRTPTARGGITPRRWWPPVLALGTVLSGPIVFAWGLNRRWGDPLLSMHAQGYFRRTAAMPWQALFRGLSLEYDHYVTGGAACLTRLGQHQCLRELNLTPDALSDDLALLATILGLVLLPLVFSRLGLGAGLYTLAAFVIPLFGPGIDNPLMSMPRFVLVVFPYFVVLAMLLSRRSLFLGISIASALAMCALLAVFTYPYFVA